MNLSSHLTERLLHYAVFNQDIIEEFRANKGKVGGVFDGLPLALITSKGAKTGLPRVSPLAYVPDGDRVLIAATYAGSERNPAWYHNLVAHPEITVEIGTGKYEATAVEAKGDERDELFARIVQTHPQLGEYRTRTTREIPVFAVVRKA